MTIGIVSCRKTGFFNFQFKPVWAYPPPDELRLSRRDAAFRSGGFIASPMATNRSSGMAILPVTGLLFYNRIYGVYLLRRWL